MSARADTAPSGSPQVSAGLVSFAVLQIGLGAFMGFAPHAFYETVGPWGPANDHYIRDMATFYAAVGVVMAIALRRPSWRAAARQARPPVPAVAGHGPALAPSPIPLAPSPERRSS